LEDAVVTKPLPPHVETAIVGSGFAGLCAAIKLDAAGRHDYVIVERNSEVGGTWQANDYPGCACDVPSHLYSFSFAPNPDWRHTFSRQPQILDYLKSVAATYDVVPKIWFNTAMTDAAWSNDDGRWTITTTQGSLTATNLILGTGGLSDPSLPELPGLETFGGAVFHSATWDHGHDLAGERVAVIGTGASAIQFVPHVQRVAERLTVFQRTAPWVLPRRDRPYRAVERRLNRIVPGLQRAVRARMYAFREMWLIGFALRPSLLKAGEKVALRHLAKQVPDPTLRAKLTPNFRLGCKRVLLSNDYYPALAQPNAEVVTDRIVGVTATGIVTEAADGDRREEPVDTIIFGTGFRVTNPPVAERVRGRDGQTLAEHWSQTGMTALHGMSIAGFPNLFMLVGPNTGLGHNSIVLMIEAQVGYLVDLLTQLSAGGVGEVEPKPRVQDAYNEGLQRKLERTVWNTGGCQSWYRDANGKNTTLWPTFTFEFMRQLRHADLREYDVRGTVGLAQTAPLTEMGSDDPPRVPARAARVVRAADLSADRGH
jgi:cation diffusion facilitator CzcD-associated flavoprotein CzcO